MRTSIIKTIAYISLLIIFPAQLFSQSPTDFFRTKGSGLWDTNSIWECSSTGQDPWIPASSYPTIASSGISILNQNVTLNSDITLSKLTIAESGSLIVNANTSLTINSSPQDDLIINGLLDLTGSIIMNGNGIVGSTGIYKSHYSTLNTAIVQMTWLEGSTVYITNYINAAPSGLNQSFYNFIWDCNQLYDIELKLTDQSEVRGTLEIKKTGKSNLFLTSSLSNIVININNLTNSSGYKLYLTKGIGLLTLNIQNDIKLLGYSTGIEMGEATGNVINLSGNLIIDPGAGINRKTTVYKGTINFTNNNPEITQTFTVGKSGDIKVIDYKILTGNRVEYISSTVPLLISPDCVFTIESGGSLTANTITNNAGITGFIIKNNASVITNSDIPATMERAVSNADWNASMDGWHMFSSPVDSQALATGGFITEPYDFYTWSEAENLWLNQKTPGNAISSFEPGKGYYVAYDNGGTKTFTGNLNVAPILFQNVSYTGSSPYAGFHLLGNPFSSAINWNNADWNRTNVCDVAQIWNETAENYLPITSLNGIIPANQGFFVQVTASTNSLTIPPTARVHSNQSFYKEEMLDILQLRVNSVGDSTFDETMVRLLDDALPGYDLADGHKLMGSDQAPQLYTVMASGEYALVNSYPSGSIPPLVDMEFKSGSAKEYELMVVTQTLPVTVYLEDRKTGMTTLLSRGTRYGFHAEPADALNRFVLHLSPLSIQATSAEVLHIYGANGNIYMSGLTGGGSYSVMNLPGQVLLTGSIRPDGITIVPATNLSRGMYMVLVEGTHRIKHRAERTCYKIIL